MPFKIRKACAALIIKNLLFTNIPSLAGQEAPLLHDGKEVILYENRIYSRSKLDKQFALATTLPILPVKNSPSSAFWWDGDQIYEAHWISRNQPVYVRSIRLIPSTSNAPGVCLPGLKGLMPENVEPALILHDRAVFLRHQPAEAGKTEASFEIGLFDLETRTQEVIHTGPEPPAFLRVAAVNRDGDALLFLNTGQIALLKSGDHQLRILEDDVWGDTQPEVLLSDTFPGHTSHFPPLPLAPPFLGRDGRIGFLWQVRRKTHWTQAMMQAQYDALTPEWKEKVIRQGLWPPKASSYEGSDTGIAGIWVDPDTGHCEAIPEEKLRALAEPERFTGILQPKAGDFGHLRETEDGRIVPIEMPREDATGLSGPSARPASPPDPRSPGGAAALSPPRPAG